MGIFGAKRDSKNETYKLKQFLEVSRDLSVHIFISRIMNILVGVTGGIAAYKAAHLVRLFVSAGHCVRVVMTPAAKDFITPLTMATVSGNPILVENFDPQNGAWNSHIKIAEWADLMVIAPATANTIAKMVCGVADNLLLCTYLSARSEVMIAPAMDLDMWAHVATRENILKLRERGVRIVEPGEGFLASGLVGKGRMAEPETIAREAELFFRQKDDFNGLRVMITAGATVEKIDPVRYISNLSTGKMGVALAEEFKDRGATVDLIMGQMSAQQMYLRAKDSFPKADIAIFAAAVADYTPREVSDLKIKHSSENLTLDLVPTKDIAFELCQNKRGDQFALGFALETNNEVDNARGKLSKKGLDAIALNSLRDPGAGFATDTNKITIIDAHDSLAFDLKSKREVASDIANYIKSKIKC